MITLERKIPLDDESRARRDRVLRQKQRGVTVMVGLLVLASCFPLWFLQTQEKAAAPLLWQVTGVILVMLALAFLCRWVFVRQLDRDRHAGYIIRAPARVISGWQTNAQRDPVLTLNIANNHVELSQQTLQRLADHVADLDPLLPGHWLVVEMTPYGRVLLSVARADAALAREFPDIDFDAAV